MCQSEEILAADDLYVEVVAFGTRTRGCISVPPEGDLGSVRRERGRNLLSCKRGEGYRRWDFRLFLRQGVAPSRSCRPKDHPDTHDYQQRHNHESIVSFTSGLGFDRRRARSAVDLANESVSKLWQGFDVARRVCRVAQDVTNLLDGIVQAMLKVYECVRRPESPVKFLTSDKLPRMIQQRLQDPECLWREFDS